MPAVDNGQHQNPVHNFGSPAHPGSSTGSGAEAASIGSGSDHVTAPCLHPDHPSAIRATGRASFELLRTRILTQPRGHENRLPEPSSGPLAMPS